VWNFRDPSLSVSLNTCILESSTVSHGGAGSVNFSLLGWIDPRPTIGWLTDLRGELQSRT
jgi:hypothetical protein